jgi:hypothetical protein
MDIGHAESETSAGAVGGVKVFVNNAGYNDPTSPDRDITDADDGEVTIVGLANYAGFVDLQGRTNDSGAVVQAYSAATPNPGTILASGTSVGSGSYSTAHVAPHQLLVGTTYYLFADRDLFVPTTATGNPYAHSKLLSTRPYTSLTTVVLRGGDAYNDNYIDISDASCIGNDYGGVASTCAGAGSNSDVNEDGVVDILDLTLMGGNYHVGQSTWAP